MTPITTRDTRRQLPIRRRTGIEWGAKRLRNRAGIIVDTKDSKAALEQLTKEHDELTERLQSVTDDKSDAMLRRIRADVAQMIYRFKRDIEEQAEKKGGSDEDPSVVEVKALAFLRGRGWTCSK